ncbi:MAG: tripartite tricarboxylate transporter substrate binding protein [Burkholderiales bacterium]|nr:tripartite tricarboxylate transporter substrate binding protein [Burkholderiales bacterium]
MKVFIALAAVALTALLGGPAAAQTYPDRPIKMINAFPPGGASDVWARMIAQGMTEFLKQPVVVESRTGGGGSIGTASAARAEPDGYTLMLGIPATHAILPHISSSLPYDPVKDFTPIALVSKVAYVLVASPGSGIDSLKALIQRAKAEPSAYNYASAGVGSETHLMGEMLRSQAQVNLLHVPYRGVGPAMTAVIGGESKLLFSPIAPALAQIKAGKVIPLATIASQRSPLLPDVPTIGEAGLPGFALTSWVAVFAPAGTPAPIVAKLNDTIVRIVRSEKIRERFKELGAESVGSTPEALRTFLNEELDKYGRIVALSGAKAD